MQQVASLGIVDTMAFGFGTTGKQGIIILLMALGS